MRENCRRLHLLALVSLAWSSTGEAFDLASSEALARFLPTELGTTWTYQGPGGTTRIESLRALEPEGRMRVEVQEQTSPLPAQHFEYQDRIDKNRWVRVGPQGEEILLRVPLTEGASWHCGRAELTVVSRGQGLGLRADTEGRQAGAGLADHELQLLAVAPGQRGPASTDARPGTSKISIRRLSCRPSSVSLLALGRYSE
jgi:hypothetical protein